MNEMQQMTNQSRVLIVDDEPIMRNMIRLVLEREHYTIAEAKNGAEALEMVASFRPDVVLMDLSMPVMDGFEACVHLQKGDADHKPLVLMVTAYDDKESVSKAYAAGAIDYITKPINWAVLTHRLRWLVKARHDEQALRVSEDQFRSVIEQADDGLLLVNKDGIIVVRNEQTEAITGIGNNEVIGQPIWETWLNISPPLMRTPQQRDAYRAEVEEILINEAVPPSVRLRESQIQRPDGEIRIAQIILFPVRTQNTFLLGVVVRDITEQRRVAAQIHLQASALTASANAIVITDTNGVISWANPAFTDLTGYSLAEAVGERLSILNSSQHDLAFFQSLWKTIQSGQVWRGEITNRRKDGTLFIDDTTITPVFDDHQRIVNYVQIKQDVTERKHLEEQLVASQKMASLGTLSAGIAHELNSPLQVITGVSQSLLRRLEQDALDPAFLKRKLENIQHNGWRCAEIVGSLRNFAHARPLEASPQDLNQLVQDALLLIEHQLASWSNISVATDLAAEIPPFPCDRNQVTQILINLLTNARDAMPNGGKITLKTRFNQKERQVCLQVMDEGVGMPESVQSRIFDPFFTTKEMGKGTGLGLSIVAGIVRGYGGEIQVRSTVNVGTTFSIRFPASDDADAVHVHWPEDGVGRFDDSAVPVKIHMLAKH
ncbi:PAS domain S-box protein [bacterium]|nr:PAS domain S-box protein [bacterium]